MVKITYRRQINPRQYEVEEASMEYEVAEDETIGDAWADVKGHVLGQLGLAYGFNEHGVIAEIRSEAFQMPVSGPLVQQVAPIPAAPVGVPGYPSACQKCGGASWWDNRADNQENRDMVRPDGGMGYKLGPDWKCKNKDCGHALWPADFEAYKHLPRRPR